MRLLGCRPDLRLNGVAAGHCAAALWPLALGLGEEGLRWDLIPVLVSNKVLDVLSTNGLNEGRVMMAPSSSPCLRG